MSTAPAPRTGPRTAVAGVALVLVAVAFDLALSGRLTLFFDLCFVVGCLALALAVRPGDVVTAGVWPPAAMLLGFAVLAAADPAALADPRDGVVQATVTGLAQHSGALAAGYVLCLATVVLRRRRADLAATSPGRPGRAGQATKRAVSPAP